MMLPVLVFFVAAHHVAAAPPLNPATQPATQPADPFASFDFDTERVSDRTVRFERSIDAATRTTLRSNLRDVLASQEQWFARWGSVVNRRDPLLRVVFDATGIDSEGEAAAGVAALYDAFAREMSGQGAFSLKSIEFVFIPEAVIKAHLDGGGSVPGVRIDRETGGVEVAYSGFLWIDSRDGRVAEFPPVLIPLPADLTPENLPEFFEGPDSDDGAGAGAAALPLFMAAESAVDSRCRVRSRDGRWFTRGFAIVLTEEALRSQGLVTVAEGVIREFAIDEATPPPTSVGLRHWLRDPYALPLPADLDGGIEDARNAYSYALARGVVERHGIGVIGQALDRLDELPRDAPHPFETALAQATGEDVAALLDRYQDYPTAEEAATRIEREYDKALSEQRYADAVMHLQRWIEIEIVLRSEEPEHLLWLLRLLDRLDRGEAGVALLRHVLRSSDPDSSSHLGLKRILIQYAEAIGRADLVEDLR